MRHEPHSEKPTGHKIAYSWDGRGKTRRRKRRRPRSGGGSITSALGGAFAIGSREPGLVQAPNEARLAAVRGSHLADASSYGDVPMAVRPRHEGGRL